MKAVVVLFFVAQLALTALANPICNLSDLLPGQSITFGADGIARFQESTDGSANINFYSPDLDKLTGYADGIHVKFPINPL